MKIIRALQARRIEVSGDRPSQIPRETFDEIMAPAKENKMRIITCAYDIETLLEQWITAYFFCDAPDSERRKEFTTQILNSDWCSFAAKRKLAIYLVNKEKLLKGEEKNSYDGLLRKAMSYRNAFSHGAFSTDGHHVKLRYFEGEPHERILDDEWLSEIEENLNTCFRLTFRLATGHEFHDEPIEE